MESTNQIPKDPLKILPIELSVLILEQFTPKSHDRRELVTVINLSSVCRNWRRVILNTSVFWTYVAINPSFNERYYSRERYPGRLELQLQRTGTALLHISWYPNGEVHPDVMRIVFTHAPLERWRSLSLCLCAKAILVDRRHGTSIINAPLSFPPLIGRFDNLEALFLWGETALPSKLVELVERSALKLRRLEAHGNHYTALNVNFPQTLRRIEMYAAGVPYKAIVAHSISTRPPTPPPKEVITMDTPAPSISANSSQKWYRRLFICF